MSNGLLGKECVSLRQCAMEDYTSPSQQDQLVETAEHVRCWLMDGAEDSLASRGHMMQLFHHSGRTVAVQASGGFITKQQWWICQQLFQNKMAFNS
jgi:hypothetical protein